MIKFILRNASRNKLYYGINLIGLTLGTVSTIFIYLYLKSELTYDRHFSDSDRIYRVALNRVYPTNEVAWASIPAPNMQVLKDNRSEIETATRMVQSRFSVKIGKELFNERRGIYADPTFFEIFDLTSIQGDLATALIQPNQLILTEALSLKYFDTKYSVGRQLFVNDTVIYQVSAVIENVPENSHFTADLILPMQDSFEPRFRNVWGNNFAFYTYIKTKEGVDVNVFGPAVEKFLLEKLAESSSGMNFQEWIDGGNSYNYFLQPLTDIHLTSNLRTEFGQNSSKSNIHLFLAVGIFILVISCINYINLSTARAGKRLKELGLKKIMGATRKDLVKQLLGESLALSFLACLLATLLTYILLPSFNNLSGKFWSVFAMIDPLFALTFLLFAGLLGIIAGIYPALKLSNVYPSKIISTNTKGGGESDKERWVRNVLVGLQFGVSFVVIVSTMIVIKQNSYLQTIDLGYDKENLVVVDNAREIQNQLEVFRDEIIKSPHIINGSGMSQIPGFITGGTTFYRGGNENAPVNVSLFFADQFTTEALGLNLIAGRDFRQDDFVDTIRYGILNENAIEQLGWTVEEAVNQTISNSTTNYRLKIIGVAQDFHIQSLKEEIRPLVISGTNQILNRLVFRVKEDQTQEAIQEIKSKWNVFSPSKPIELSFLDEDLNTLYIAEAQTQKLFSIFTILAIFLAAFGMYGLSAYLTELKRKEVAIRKTLGASEASILKYFTLKQFKIILFSIVFGLPLSYYLGSKWLENFAYRIDIDFGLMLGSIGLLLIVGILSIGWYSVKAALENPINMLRE